MTIKGSIKSFAANVLSANGILDLIWNKEPSWRILMYHRVCRPEELFYPLQDGMYVRPETFKMHCEFLKKNCNVILVDELIQKLAKKESLPKRSIAITFDDGWKDNLENAFPVLKSLGLPATIFLPTDYIDSSKLFWTDEIARALELTPEVFANYPELAQLQSQPLNEQLERVLAFLFSLSLDKREQQVKELIQKLPANGTREFLTWTEVTKLESFGIKVGSHSHTHRLFKELSKEERIEEFEQSREILWAKSLLTSNVFVFPGGSHTAEMDTECTTAGYLSSLKTDRSYQSETKIFPRVGIHEDISINENLFKFRLAL